MKRLLAIAALAALPIALAVPASAAPATHDVLVENYDASEHFAAGEAEPCAPWAGTFHEIRNGEIKLVTINSGPHAGEVHVTGVIAGFIQYIPDDSSLPTYSGTYREKLDAVLLEMSFEDEAERIAQFRLRSRLAGTDGSALLLTMSGKVTRNGNGEVVVDLFNLTCE